MSIGDGPFSAAGIGVGPIGLVERVNSLLGIGSQDMWANVNAQQVHADLLAAQQAAMVPPLSQPNVANLAQRAREMFLKRMGGIRAEMKVTPDDFLQCHIYNDQVYVFYCFGGRNGVTAEGIDLFPSDQLITQFRLVLT